jgi:hypothetical protein
MGTDSACEDCAFAIGEMTLEFGIAVKYPDRTLMRTSVAEVAAVGDAKQFRHARDLAA